jgi:hypothetical protein
VIVLIQETAAWEDERNTQQATWISGSPPPMRTSSPRKLYPIIHPIDNVKEPLLIKA